MAITKVELKDALNALATNSGIDKVTGIYNGEPSNISKADLATVVAGLLSNIQVEFIPNGFDFNTVNNNYKGKTMYLIGNLKNQTINPPLKSGAACIFFTVGVGGNNKWDLLIGIDEPLMYGRYYIGTSAVWHKLI